MKYGEWLTEWLNNYVRISAKHRTIERYSEIINNHLIPSVGEIELQELTPILLRRVGRWCCSFSSLTGSLSSPPQTVQ